MPRLQRYRILPSTLRKIATTLAIATLAAASLCVFGAWALWAIAGAILSFAAWSRAQQRWRNNGELMLDSDGATISGPGIWKKIRRDRIDDAYEDSAGGIVVRMRDGSAIEGTLDVPPRTVLAHLGMTLDQRALSVPLRGTLGSVTRGLLTFVGTFPLGALLSTWLGPAALAVGVLGAVLATVLVVRTLRPRVVIGVDGVRIIGVLRPRFIDYASIANVRVVTYGPYKETGVAIDTASGRRVLPMIGQSTEQIHALARRIEEGRARHAKSQAHPLELLDRNGRSILKWQKSVRTAMLGGFRDVALGRNDLEEILADPKAPLERRIGAALALREEQEGRARIRIAAETAADAGVRAALEAASHEEIDEAALLRSLSKK